MDLKKVKHIIIHCSGTIDGKVADWPAIRNYHMRVNGWKDVGYHMGFERVGGKLMAYCGRPLNVQGAHCSAGNMNPASLGVCFVGDFDKQTPDPELLRFGAQYVAGFCEALEIPVNNILPHRAYEDKKTCPGSKFDMIIFRGFVSSYLEKD